MYVFPLPSLRMRAQSARGRGQDWIEDLRSDHFLAPWDPQLPPNKFQVYGQDTRGAEISLAWKSRPQWGIWLPGTWRMRRTWQSWPGTARTSSPSWHSIRRLRPGLDQSTTRSRRRPTRCWRRCASAPAQPASISSNPPSPQPPHNPNPPSWGALSSSSQISWNLVWTLHSQLPPAVLSIRAVNSQARVASFSL